MRVTGGATNVTTYFVLRDAADGTATTGATIANIDLQYVRSGAAPSAKVDATELAATDTAHTDNYAKEIDATDAPGLYRVDWPDAAFAAGVPEVILTVKLASSFTEHMSVLIDPPANTTKISGSSTAADNAEIVYDTDFATNYNTTRDAWVTNFTDYIGTLAAAAIATDAITADKIAANAITSSELADDAITAAKIADAAIDAATFAADVDAEVRSYLGMASADLDTQLDAIVADTGEIGAAGAGLSAIPWNASWDTEVQSECADALTAFWTTPATLVDLIWDEATAGHASAGTTGKAVTDILADTNELQSDDYPTSIAAVQTTVDAIETDTQDLQTQVGTAGAGLTAINLPNQTMDITGDITGNLSGSVGSVTGAVGSVTGAVGSVTAEVDADVTKISGSATAADNLEASALGVVPGACEGTPSTTVIQTNLAESTDDHYIGRIVVFTSGNAAGEASDITDYTGATGTITVTALTTAPAATDTFVIV